MNKRQSLEFLERKLQDAEKFLEGFEVNDNDDKEAKNFEDGYVCVMKLAISIIERMK